MKIQDFADLYEKVIIKEFTKRAAGATQAVKKAKELYPIDEEVPIDVEVFTDKKKVDGILTYTVRFDMELSLKVPVAAFSVKPPCESCPLLVPLFFIKRDVKEEELVHVGDRIIRVFTKTGPIKTVKFGKDYIINMTAEILFKDISEEIWNPKAATKKTKTPRKRIKRKGIHVGDDVIKDALELAKKYSKKRDVSFFFKVAKIRKWGKGKFPVDQEDLAKITTKSLDEYEKYMRSITFDVKKGEALLVYIKVYYKARKHKYQVFSYGYYNPNKGMWGIVPMSMRLLMPGATNWDIVKMTIKSFLGESLGK